MQFSAIVYLVDGATSSEVVWRVGDSSQATVSSGGYLEILPEASAGRLLLFAIPPADDRIQGFAELTVAGSASGAVTPAPTGTPGIG